MSKEKEYESTVRILIEFLEDNEQYGDDWSKQKDDLNDLFTEVKRLLEENKKQLDVLSTLDEMIRYGNDHVEMMKALEQGLDLPETWKEMIE